MVNRLLNGRVAGIPLKLLAATTILVFAAIIFLQLRWLAGSFRISKRHYDIETAAVLDEVARECQTRAIDSSRVLLQHLLRPGPKLNVRVFNYPTGIVIGIRNGNHAYVQFALAATDTAVAAKAPHLFLKKCVDTAGLAELRSIYYALIGVQEYPPGSAGDTLAMALQDLLANPYAPEQRLGRSAAVVFRRRNITAGAQISYFADVDQRKVSLPPPTGAGHAAEVVEVESHGETSPFAAKVKTLSDRLAALNASPDSSYAIKVIADEVGNEIRSTVPFLQLSVNVSAAAVVRNMLISLAGSILLTLFIGALLAALLYLLVRQKQLWEIRNDFISNMSHEMKTPIASSLAAVQALRYTAMGDRSDKEAFYIDTAETELKRLSQVAVNVLNGAVFETDQFVLHPESFNLCEMLRQIIAPWEIPGVKRAYVTLVYDSRETITADKLHLHQAIANLVENAVNYSAAPARITISTRETPASVIISVADEGPGIPEAYRAQIFERFFRLPEQDHHGYGLGLYYVKTIAEKHGGSVVLERSGATGSTFSITVPQ